VDSYLDEVRSIHSKLESKGVTLKIIQGEELEKGGFGGLWGVGKASLHPPALAILSWEKPGNSKGVAWVGKGIVYDTGGLRLV